jgi:NADP-dependent aldehyde dehydrogenase
MLKGLSLIGPGSGEPAAAGFRAVNPGTGETLEPLFHGATRAEVDRAAALAQAAAPALQALDGKGRGALLRAMADGLEAAAAELVPRVMQETALAEPRVRGELARTCFQLRLFAQVAEEGSWVEARIDPGDASRAPLPKPDLRSMLQPLGPVAVFGASNFPLAFGVLGGDTASALAAGCPVLAKAHPLNPGTSELAARVAQEALSRMGLPAGVLSLLFDPGFEVARQLIQHPAIRAAGFTGSLRGGKALLDLAAGRPDPIPVYAEMGSVNPVTVLPRALAARGAAIAASLAAAVLGSVGQLCTCPGLVVAVRGPGLAEFQSALAGALAAAAPAPMLGEGLAGAYRAALAQRSAAGARAAFPQRTAEPRCAAPALLEVSGRELLDRPSLAEEVFGPFALLVICGDEAERLEVLAALPGQLTASLWMDPDDAQLAADLLPILQARAGRVLFNGVPTGVEVGHAMVHGGPWPATSAAHSTSVGTRAITRWARPVCYQDAPEALLPVALRRDNPLGLWRWIDGVPGRH